MEQTEELINSFKETTDATKKSIEYINSLDSAEVNRLLESLDDLKAYILAKSRLDCCKDNIILELSKELVTLKKDFYKQTIGPVINDVEEVIKDFNRTIEFHQDEHIEKIEVVKMISLLNSYMEDLKYITKKYDVLKMNI